MTLELVITSYFFPELFLERDTRPTSSSGIQGTCDRYCVNSSDFREAPCVCLHLPGKELVDLSYKWRHMFGKIRFGIVVQQT